MTRPMLLDVVYEATRMADFVEAWRESPAVRYLFAARTLGERAVSAARGQPAVAPTELDSLRLADLPTRGEWILLGEDRPHEIAFGVVGRFWAGETVWEEIDAAEFKSFDRPGRARMRYWRPLSHFIGFILRAQLGVIARAVQPASR